MELLTDTMDDGLGQLPVGAILHLPCRLPHLRLLL